MFVHPTATVDDGATIGDGARIWHHCHIRSGAKVGSGTQLGKNVYVDDGASIGARCKVQNNVSVYMGVQIDDEVFVGPSVVFTNDLLPRAVNDGWTVTPTFVEAGASIGANTTIKCGVTIGRYAMIGAGSVVTHDVAPHQLVVGNPARPVGWVDRAGHVVSRSAEQPPDEATLHGTGRAQES